MNAFRPGFSWVGGLIILPPPPSRCSCCVESVWGVDFHLRTLPRNRNGAVGGDSAKRGWRQGVGVDLHYKQPFYCPYILPSLSLFILLVFFGNFQKEEKIKKWTWKNYILENLKFPVWQLLHNFLTLFPNSMHICSKNFRFRRWRCMLRILDNIIFGPEFLEAVSRFYGFERVLMNQFWLHPAKSFLKLDFVTDSLSFIV